MSSIKEGDRVACIDFGTVQGIDEDGTAEVLWEVSGCLGDMEVDRLKPAGEVPTSERQAELLEANNRYQQEARDARAALRGGFQDRVHNFMVACFGNKIAADGTERNHRFLEEALELVQSLGCTASEAHQLVDYVFGRPVGSPYQEAGGVGVTFAALCNAHGLDMAGNGETELTRVWGKIDQIRAKQAPKAKHSPLPEHAAEGAQAPGFTPAAEGKLASLLADGWSINGYALFKEGRRGLIDFGGFVGWWRNAQTPSGEDAPRFPVGAQVTKTSSYPFPGEVRAAFTTIEGNERFVIEATGADYRGMLHIFNGDQLAVATAKGGENA